MTKCRHLGSLPVNRLAENLQGRDPQAAFACLTCGHNSVSLKDANQHARQKNHPLSLTNASGLFCHVCSGEPQVTSGKDLKLLEKIQESIALNAGKHKPLSVSSTATVHSSSPPKGIVNLGNTCFMNATLQSLAACQVFPREIPASDSNRTWAALIATLTAIHSSEKTKLAPRSLLNAVSKRYPKFGSFLQQDAHEFLRCLFNCVAEEEAKPAPYEASFLGKMVSRVTCGRCRRVSDTEEPFLDVALSLSAPKETQMERSFSRMSLSSDEETVSAEEEDDDESCSLKQLFRNWSAPIVLSGENGYYCEHCAPKDPSVLQSATLIYRLGKIPPLLVIHLQRFRTVLRTASGSGKRKKASGGLQLDVEKDHRRVKYPSLLRLPRQAFLDERDADCEYELMAFVEHEGASTSSGHYTAIVNYASEYYLASDTRVSAISPQRALSANPYILFYRLRQK